MLLPILITRRKNLINRCLNRRRASKCVYTDHNEKRFGTVHATGLSGKKRKKEKRKETRGKKEEHPSLITGRCNPPRH